MADNKDHNTKTLREEMDHLFMGLNPNLEQRPHIVAANRRKHRVPPSNDLRTENKPNPKNYVGNGWEVTIPGTKSKVINIKLKKADLAVMPENEHGEIALTVCRRKNIDPKTSSTHYVIQDKIKAK